MLENGNVIRKVSNKHLLSDRNDYSKHRHKFVCRNRTSSCPKDCSGIFWSKHSLELSLFRLSLQTNPTFKKLYKFRPTLLTLLLQDGLVLKMCSIFQTLVLTTDLTQNLLQNRLAIILSNLKLLF